MQNNLNVENIPEDQSSVDISKNVHTDTESVSTPEKVVFMPPDAPKLLPGPSLQENKILPPPQSTPAINIQNKQVLDNGGKAQKFFEKINSANNNTPKSSSKNSSNKFGPLSDAFMDTGSGTRRSSRKQSQRNNKNSEYKAVLSYDDEVISQGELQEFTKVPSGKRKKGDKSKSKKWRVV